MMPDDPDTTLQITISGGVSRAISAAAFREGVSRIDIMLIALADYLEIHRHNLAQSHNANIDPTIHCTIEC